MSEDRARFGDRRNLDRDRWRAVDDLSANMRSMVDFARPSGEERSTSAAWFDDFAWLNRALRLAFRPRLLLFAVLGWVAVTGGWRMCGSVFTQLL